MSFDSPGALNAVAALVTPLVTEHTLGVPAGLSARLSAYTFLVPSGEVEDRTASGGKNLRQVIRVRSVLGYRTDGDVAAAEAALADAMDDLRIAFFTARNAGSLAAYGAPSLDAAVAGGPEYEGYAAQEYRRTAIDFVFDQQHTLA